MPHRDTASQEGGSDDPEAPRPQGLAVARLGLAAGLLFLLLVALRLHGFSLPIWHPILGEPGAPEILLGEARFIRMDDWAVHLPLILAQGVHEPAFPVVNRDIGLGQNMLVPFPLPVAHPVALFRPTLWGFFLGPDLGLAWMWWLRGLALLAAGFLLLRLVVRGDDRLALAGAMLLGVSPFFQFWSLNAAPVVAWAALAIVALHGLAAARSPRRRLAMGLLLGWSAAAFALALYPPYQVVLAWLGVALLVGLALEARPWRGLGRGVRARAGALLLAAAIVLAAGLSFYASAHEAIARLAATEYPGQRVAAGGGLPLWGLWNANLAAPLQVESWGPLENLCEAASFLLLFPALALAFAWRAWRGDRLDPVAAALLLYLAVLGWWSSQGLPAFLAELTLLSRVPSPRAVLGLGLADALLLMRYLATGFVRPEPGVPRHAGRPVAALGGLLLAAVAAWAAHALAGALPGFRVPVLAALVGAHALAGYLLLRRWRPVWLVGGLAAALAASTLWFNPLVRGGSEALRESPLARRILALDAAAGGESVWIGYDAFFASNLFRMLGVRSLTGLYTVPQPELWRVFDPDGSQRNITNRYGYVWAERRSEASPGFERKAVDVFVIHANPLEEAFRRLGATHVLAVAPEERGPGRFPELLHRGSFGRHHLFAIPRPDPPAAAEAAAAP